jgi:TetR/AcrR family transcriptional regulator, cholesterol catabolism regulator
MTTSQAKGEPKTRRKRNGEVREVVGRERVMEAALRMFLQRGYPGTSMKALAQELGISAPALYWYFPSKEDLYVAVIETAMEDFLTHVRQSITETDPVLKLGQMVRAHVTWQLQQSDAARAFDLTMSASLSYVPEERLAPIVKMEKEYAEEFRAVLEEGRKAKSMTIDDVKTTAFAIITLCEYVHTWFNPEGAMTVAAVANRYEGLVRNMVGASATTRKR